MRLLNLSLESWRGIDSRQLELSGGVTLIEGPNEIGKSTIVEAVRMLFSEMDSSKKKNVKAIQPVGQDVGSHIQAEVKTGDYHFIYSKTYNRATQTSLDILAPNKKQLTGREAHEEVERILGETVDLALWDALLVKQGEKVALANFQDSSGLARALDEAAGSSQAGGEDTGLYGVVQAEYEKYFTLKTGKSRFSGEEGALKKAELSLEVARQALNDVEEDSQAHDRSTAEVNRLMSLLPGLKTKLNEYERDWTSIKFLKDRVEAKEKELASARALQKAANDANADRLVLVNDIELNNKNLETAKENIEPLQSRATDLKQQAKSAQLATTDLNQAVKTAKAVYDLAQIDENQIRSLTTLEAEKARLKQLDNISKAMKVELKVVGSIAIDSAIIQDFRKAERLLDIAGGKRDSAATVLSITADQKLDLQLDEETIQLGKAETTKRKVTSELVMRIPGVASIQLTPPLSVAELQAEADDANDAFEALKSQFGVNDLKEAETLNERKIAAQREIDRRKEQEHSTLKGASREEIEQAVTTLQANYDNYLQQRNSTQALPASPDEAAARVSEARKVLDDAQEALDAQRLKSEDLQAEFAVVDSRFRVAEQDLIGIEAALKVKQDSLTKAQLAEADTELAERAEKASSRVKQFEQEASALKASLAESSPDSIEALLTNAGDVYKRANTDLISAEQSLAVLADRLQQAQADGRFETMEAAEQELQERENTFNATRRRATAVELLWSTLNKHRNAARKAYVRPLKEAIERLGAIVFGAGFEVELGEDWSLLTRTLHGKTLPFDDLSVGAKEQMGILTRLAAGQIVSKQGGVPLIIDDALGFSDPSRLETMGAAIAAAGKQCQIIILTCSPGRFTHVGNAQVVKF